MIVVKAEATEGAALEKEANDTIDEFDDWFQSELKNSPMVPVEVAVLKTFLWWAVQRGRGLIPPFEPPPI